VASLQLPSGTGVKKKVLQEGGENFACFPNFCGLKNSENSYSFQAAKPTNCCAKDVSATAVVDTLQAYMVRRKPRQAQGADAGGSMMQAGT